MIKLYQAAANKFSLIIVCTISERITSRIYEFLFFHHQQHLSHTFNIRLSQFVLVILSNEYNKTSNTVCRIIMNIKLLFDCRQLVPCYKDQTINNVIQHI